MNKSERLMNERMTFVSRRGRTAESQRIDWLRNLRAERQHDADKFVVNVYGCRFATARTMRQAKIKGYSGRCKLMNEFGLNPWIAVYDRATGILLWKN